MFGYLLLAAAIALGTYLIARGFMGTATAQAVRVLWQSVAVLAAVAILFFLLSGRPQIAVMALIFMLVAGSGIVADVFWKRRKGRSSKVDTPFLRLVLDHDTGQVTGDILDGPYAGRRIEMLRIDELIELYQFYIRQDAPSARLVEAFLDRIAPTWRERPPPGPDPSGPGERAPMTRGEAYRVLGLHPGATDDQIRAAHRRLMQEHHPDRGGTADRAARINRARDILLEE